MTKYKVHFFSADRDIPVRNRSVLKSRIELLFNREGKKLDSINYIFCSDKYLRKINKTYLGHDYNTDVITFPLSEKAIQGEVYISVDRVRHNAKAYGTRFSAEALRVMIHGALHLCGYNDETGRQKAIMRQKEDLYLL